MVTEIETVILDKSILSIYGTSNITDFECKYEGSFESQTLRHQINFTGDSARVSGSLLPLTVDSFDCGKRAINKDFKTTLKYKEYPQINIDLKKVYPVTGIPEFAEVNIELAGRKRLYTVQLSEELMADGTFRVQGIQNLKLSDFELDPPRPLLGLLKVRDDLEIHFDLYIRYIL